MWQGVVTLSVAESFVQGVHLQRQLGYEVYQLLCVRGRGDGGDRWRMLSRSGCHVVVCELRQVAQR